MNESKIDDVIADLAILHGIGIPRYLVGRDELLSGLQGCYAGDVRSSAWLFGPRRIGKTAIAQEVERRARTTQTTAYSVDAIDANSFDELLDRMCNKVPNGTLSGHSSPRARFEALARTSERGPLLLVFDEMDEIALSMSTTEQAFLRRVKGEYPRLSYLFISGREPAQIMEEVPEISSRLLGICFPARVHPLRKHDVERLCRMVADDLSIPAVSLDAAAIWSAVGGFTVAVRSGLKKIAIARRHDPELDNDERHARLLDIAHAHDADLRGYWRSLRSETRAVLAGTLDPSRCERALREDGLYDRRGISGYELLVSRAPSWNADAAESLGATDRNNLDNTLELFRLAADINTTLRYRGKTIAFRAGEGTFHLHRLLRFPCNQAQFVASVDYLYKVFYEGARSVDGPHPKAWLLPSPMDKSYAASDVVQALNTLRCLLFHDKTRDRDSEQPNRHYKDAGSIYLEYCGQPQPVDDAARALVRSEVVRRLVELLHQIHEQLELRNVGAPAPA